MQKIIRTLLLVAAMLMPMTLKAQMSGMQVIVTVNDTSMGTTIPSPGVHVFPVGSTASVRAVANDGYHLTGWSVQLSVSGTLAVDTTIDMAVPDVFDFLAPIHGGSSWVVGPADVYSVVTVVANFAVGTYVPDSMLVNVAVNDTSMGTTIPAPGPHYFYEGDTCSVVAVPNDGYVLTGWDIEMSMSGSVVVDTTIDVALPDVFDFLALLNGGDPWVVEAGYGSYTISVTANFVDASQYIPDSMIVNVSVNDPTRGIVIPGIGTHYYAEGDTVSVIAEANPGSHLTGWDIQVVIGGAVAIDTTIDIAIRDVFDLMILIEEIRSRGDMSYFDLFQLLARPIGNWVVEPLYAQATFNLTANFAAGNPASTNITYAVQGHNATQGTITPAEGTYTINAGEAVVVSATPNEGYEMSAWIMEYTYTMWGFPWPVISDTVYVDDPAFANPVRYLGVIQQMLDTIPQLGMYVTAVFAPQQHMVTLATSDATMGSVAPAGITSVSHGQSFTATATANNGYHFVNWVNGNGAVVSEANPYSFNVTEDVSLTAVFAAGGYYEVTVSYDATKGSVAGIPEEAVLEGTNVTLTASAYDGYQFTGWSVEPGYANIVTDNPLILIVTSDVTVTANFERENAIGDVETVDIQVYSIDGKIVVKGVENLPVSVYDVVGRQVQAVKQSGNQAVIEVPVAGVYMVKAGNGAPKRVVVVR